MRKHVFVRVVLVVTIGILLLFSGCLVIIDEEVEPEARKTEHAQSLSLATEDDGI